MEKKPQIKNRLLKNNWNELWKLNYKEDIEETCLVWEFGKNLIITLMDVFIETLDDYETVSQVLSKNYVFLL